MILIWLTADIVLLRIKANYNYVFLKYIMKKKCSKCKKIFECKSFDINSCWCSNIKISEMTKSFIKENYANCLCSKCLKDSEVSEKKKELTL